MRIVTVKMPETYIEAIDELVKQGKFSSRSEAIRAAVRELIRRELWIEQPIPTNPARKMKNIRIFDLE